VDVQHKRIEYSSADFCAICNMQKLSSSREVRWLLKRKRAQRNIVLVQGEAICLLSFEKGYCNEISHILENCVHIVNTIFLALPNSLQ
jgi:hypothetical protein